MKNFREITFKQKTKHAHAETAVTLQLSYMVFSTPINFLKSAVQLKTHPSVKFSNINRRS